MKKIFLTIVALFLGVSLYGYDYTANLGNVGFWNYEGYYPTSGLIGSAQPGGLTIPWEGGKVRVAVVSHGAAPVDEDAIRLAFNVPYVSIDYIDSSSGWLTEIILDFMPNYFSCDNSVTLLGQGDSRTITIEARSGY